MDSVKKKKTLVAIALMFLIIVIGATFAVFMSTADYNNDFNLGNYNIVTKEIFTSPDNWAPGDTIPKVLTAKNEGTIPASVRMSYTEEWTDEDGNVVNMPEGTAIINFTTPSAWTENNGYYYYNHILESNDETAPLIEGVTLNPNLNETTCEIVGGVEQCKNDVSGIGGYHYNLTFTIETVQYDKALQVWNIDSLYNNFILPEGKTKDTLQYGDLVCIGLSNGKDCFNFIRYDNDDMVFITRYTLDTDTYSSSKGTQYSEYNYMHSALSRSYKIFSDSNFWVDSSNNLLPEFGSEYPVDVYSLENMDPTNSKNCSYYIENYKNVLESFGANIKEARLLTYSEATSPLIGCDSEIQEGQSRLNCPTDGFIVNTKFRYTLGTASAYNDLWGIDTDAELNPDITRNLLNGIRPVIVIDKDEFNA